MTSGADSPDPVLTPFSDFAGKHYASHRTLVVEWDDFATVSKRG
jgi:hypothetical protein